MTDPLHEEVEREMRAASYVVVRESWRPGLRVVVLDDATEIAVRIARRQAEAAEGALTEAESRRLKGETVEETTMITLLKRAEAAEKALAKERERRGHAVHCNCHQHPGESCESGRYVLYDDHIDPRCAPPPAAERLRNESTPEGRQIWDEVERAASSAPPAAEPTRCKTCGSIDPGMRNRILGRTPEFANAGAFKEFYDCDDDAFHSPRKEPKPCLAHFLFRCPECHSPRKEAGDA